MKQNVTGERIIQLCRKIFPNCHVDKKVLYNIRVGGIKLPYMLHAVDKTSTQLLAQKFPDHVHILCLEDKNIQIAIITPNMKTFRASTGIFCVDSTHNTTYYGFYLSTILTVDDQNRGRPIAHFISSNEQAKSLKVFFEFFKKNYPVNDHPVLITDDYPAYWNTWKELFPTSSHILCRWHIRKNWKKHCQSSYKNVWLLEKLMKSKSENEYINNLEVIRQEFSQKSFEYLEKNYLNRTEKWVLYQLPYKNAYNLHIESFHKILKKKQIQLQKKQENRLSDLYST